jgi:CHAT domain-containing protein
VLRDGEGATEERLCAELQRHSVVHLATHGFFQPEGLSSLWDEARSGRSLGPTRMDPSSASVAGRHPGHLSGLVCAGVNAPAREDLDDGYLTAEELSWLDLSGVELVVLSACETGLGSARSGEGLIGLRRAFLAAGAGTVVSSLWPVDDEATLELMAGFYRGLWQAGRGRLEALSAAQLAMLEHNRDTYGRPAPSTWGAFVLGVDWR